MNQPISWLRLPPIGTAVEIAGMDDVVWCYLGPVEYGKDYQACVLVRWHERTQPYAQRVVAPVGWVLEETAREASAS